MNHPETNISLHQLMIFIKEDNSISYELKELLGKIVEKLEERNEKSR